MMRALESQRLAPFADGAGPLSKDQSEALPYRGRTVLVFGGSSGTGETAVREFLNLGADLVYLGTRAEERFAKSQKRLGDLFDADVSRLRPFVADVADPNQVDDAVRRMKGDGVAPTNVFFFQAAGIEEFADPLKVHLDSLLSIHERNLPDRAEQIAAGMELLNSDLAGWLANDEYTQHAEAVNYTGPVAAINILAQAYGGGFDITDINSTFGHLGEGPPFYKNVLSKYQFSQWLGKSAPALHAQGITAAEIVAPVIADTGVGYMITSRILPHCPRDIQELVIDTLVKKADVVQAARLHTDPSHHERLAAMDGLDIRYVMRQGGSMRNGKAIVGPNLTVTSEMPAKMRVDVSRFPF